MGKHRWPTAGDAGETGTWAPAARPADGSAAGALLPADGREEVPDSSDARAVRAARGEEEGRQTVSTGVQWRVARSAALVFAGVALAVGAALFLVRSSEPSAAAVSVQLDSGVADDTAEPAAGDGAARGATAGDGAAGDAAVGAATGERPGGSGGEDGTGGVGPGSPGEAPTHEPTDRSGDPLGVTGGTGGGAQGIIIVYVTGAVAAPGVVTVPSGTRLFDVMGRAGGALPEADLEGINLAATPSDGQHIHVLAVGEEPRITQDLPGTSSPAQTPGRQVEGPGGGGAPGGSPGGIDINTATLAEIELLPRVGPVLGQRIIDWRTEHGPFGQAADIDAVPGIGPAMLDGILPLIVVR
ncbi:helix-hairpin-helix domain-containing protein [Arthrobacter sp. TmT3-37]